MATQNTNQTSRMVMLIMGFVFFVVGGWSLIFLFPEFRKDMPVYIIPFLALITLGYIYIFLRILINKNWFRKSNQKMEETFEKNAFGKVMLTEINAFTVDIQVFKVIFKKFELFLPFLLSIIAIFAVISFSYFILSDPGQLLYTFLIDSFVCCSIFVLGYITLGYILRRKYFNISEGVSVIFKRYFKLFWFVILLTFTWILMLLIFFSGKKKSALAGIAQTASLGILSVFKLFVYTNIVRASLGDEKSSFEETYEFAKKDIYQLLRVWFGSGLLVGFIWIMGLMFLAIGAKLEIIPITDASKNIIAPIFLGFFVFILVFRSFAEQIGIFSVYLKDKNNIDIFSYNKNMVPQNINQPLPSYQTTSVSKNKRSSKENVFDFMLWIIFILPIFLSYLTLFGPLCNWPNEGSNPTCINPIFQPLANIMGGFFLIIGFGGIILYAPFVLIFYIGSTVSKIKRWVGYLKNKTRPDKIGLKAILGTIIWVISTIIIFFIIMVSSAILLI